MQKLGKVKIKKTSELTEKRNRNRTIFFVLLVLFTLALVNGIFKFVKLSDYVSRPIYGTDKKGS